MDVLPLSVCVCVHLCAKKEKKVINRRGQAKVGGKGFDIMTG